METVSNKSNIQFKTIQDDLNKSNILLKLNESKLPQEKFEDAKSYRSTTSRRNNQEENQINIAISGPKSTAKNPEESFVSYKSKIKNQSFMNKSFAS
jgi:hypothetical protein